MFRIARAVTEPKGASHEMELIFDEVGLTITATGPAGARGLQLSREEAETLYDLLTYARPSYKKTEVDPD